MHRLTHEKALGAVDTMEQLALCRCGRKYEGPGNGIDIFAVPLYLFNRQTGAPDTKNNNHGLTPNDGGNVDRVLLVPC